MEHLPQLSVVMPCLDEAETLAICIRKALKAFDEAGIRGEVVIADNGSSDGSREIAEAEGARLIDVVEKGYGNALRGGIAAARAEWIVMGDADDSYDFSKLDLFVSKLAEDWELVMGCRMPRGGGTLMPGAMPWKHRWIGNPALSFIGRLLFKCPARDFHCGLRAFTKSGYERMDLKTTGMEFASELVIKATLIKLRITEVPITLHPDGRTRPPHLRSWRDGWRHLRFMLLFSPRWLFLMPGVAMAMIGLAGLLVLTTGRMIFGAVVLDVGTMVASSMLLLVGVQLIFFAIFTRVIAVSAKLLPPKQGLKRFFRVFTLEGGLLFGLTLLAIGSGLFCWAFWDWKEAGFQGLSYSENLRRIIPASTLIVLGIQSLFGSFFLGVLELRPGIRD